jgi:hypothetical protein
MTVYSVAMPSVPGHFELPTADSLPGLDDLQRENADRLIGTLHEAHGGVLHPGWEQRTELYRRLTYQEGTSELSEAVASRVCDRAHLGPTATRTAMTTFRQAPTGELMGRILDMNDEEGIVEWGRRVRQAEPGIIFMQRRQPTIALGMTMLGTEKRALSAVDSLRAAEAGRKTSDLEQYVGQPAAVRQDPEFAPPALSRTLLGGSLARYRSYKLRGAYPPSPEELVGLTRGAMEDMRIIPPAQP